MTKNGIKNDSGAKPSPDIPSSQITNQKDRTGETEQEVQKKMRETEQDLSSLKRNHTVINVVSIS